MAKRLMALLGVLALMLATAVPALAESEPQLTGVIEKPELTTYQYGTHAITDELGNFYALESDIVDLDAYVGQRVTVSGAFVPGYEDGQVEGGPPLFSVTHVEATGPGGPPPGPMPGSSATFTYELAVECEPPANAEFLGFTALESLVTTPLTDPDGDDVYTGSQTVPRFAPGPTPPGTEPIALSPVRIVQGPPTGMGPLGPEYRVIKDFGAVKAEDTTLSASVSFCDDGTNPVDPVDPAPVEPAPVEPAPGDANGGSGSGGTGGGSMVSGDTSNADKGGSGAVDGNASVTVSGSGSVAASGSAGQGGASPVANVLPATGGVLPIAGLAGLALVAGGLLFRRVTR